jgi:putative transposase
MDETYIKITGQWCDLDRAMDRSGQIIDVLLTEPHDERAATRVLTRAIRRHGVPETITIAGRATNAAAIRSDHAERRTAIVLRQVTYRTHRVE